MTPPDTKGNHDPFNLTRFVTAQAQIYDTALHELKSGRKVTHWMWFIFPQMAGLGLSPISREFAVSNLEEARAYLHHATLGPRLAECAETLLNLHHRSLSDIFGTPDDMKLRSCMTLFEQAAGPGSVFERVLDRYCTGERDPLTLRSLK